jgi:hypothetical protein
MTRIMERRRYLRRQQQNYLKDQTCLINKARGFKIFLFPPFDVGLWILDRAVLEAGALLLKAADLVPSETSSVQMRVQLLQSLVRRV